MTLLLTYHRILPTAPPENVHVLSQQTLARQIELILDSGIAVAAPAEFAAPGENARHRLGLTFDDGYLSDLACADMLAAHGMKAIFFISTANIGERGYLDAEDIRELDAMGMTLGSHSHLHVRLTTFDPATAETQIRESKERLENVLGKPVGDFAFPGGACTRLLSTMVRSAGFSRQYTLAWGINTELQMANGAFSRSCVVQGMTDDYFLRLISGRNNVSRKMHYLLKGAAAQMFNETLYRRLRAHYLGAPHDASGIAPLVR